MLIHEFHSKLMARKEQSVLFDALRRLRLLDGPERMVANTDGDGDDGGDGGDGMRAWNIWTGDTGTSGQGLCTAAQAV
jgi:hypothetical protein